jgi:GT2 family glycosyltransferase
MASGKLAVAYATDANLGTGGALFLMSLTNTIDTDWAGPRRIAGRRIHILAGGGGIDQARNDMVARFLAMDADWLLMVDADMVWKPGDLDALFAAADPMGRPILGALCFGARFDDSNVFPAMLMDDGNGGLYRLENYPRNQIVRVTATGAAFLLVHRRVFEHMAEHFPPNRPKVFFAISYLANGERIGEDVHWCLQAGRLGFPIHVHTGVCVGHGKVKLVNEAVYDEGQKATVRRKRAEMKLAR